MLSVPTSTAPAASRRSIVVASRAAGARLRLIFDPASVTSPATSNRFLTANGTPASGPGGRPFRRAASTAAALASARSASAAVKALSTGFNSAMRASAALTTALALVRPSLTAAAISLACVQAASMTELGHEHRRRLGVVRQREIAELTRQAQDDVKIGLHRRPPCRLERKIERARRA